MANKLSLALSALILGEEVAQPILPWMVSSILAAFSCAYLQKQSYCSHSALWGPHVRPKVQQWCESVHGESLFWVVALTPPCVFFSVLVCILLKQKKCGPCSACHAAAGAVPGSAEHSWVMLTCGWGLNDKGLLERPISTEISSRKKKKSQSWLKCPLASK